MVSLNRCCQRILLIVVFSLFHLLTPPHITGITNHDSIATTTTTRSGSSILSIAVDAFTSPSSSSSSITSHRMTTAQRQRRHLPLLLKRQPRSVSSPLRLFLPPGGDGPNDNSSELKQVTSTILTFVAILAFFISPLGGLFFAVFNSVVAFLILTPIAALTAFTVWEYFNTLTGPCPTCGVPMKVLKNEAPTICYNCGSIVQAKDGNIYLASQNNRNSFLNNNNGDNVEDLTPLNRNVFTTIVEEITTVWSNPSSESEPEETGLPRSPSSQNRNKNTIIDVNVVEDE